jgi:hypothetical protein
MEGVRYASLANLSFVKLPLLECNDWRNKGVVGSESSDTHYGITPNGGGSRINAGVTSNGVVGKVTDEDKSGCSTEGICGGASDAGTEIQAMVKVLCQVTTPLMLQIQIQIVSQMALV